MISSGCLFLPFGYNILYHRGGAVSRCLVPYGGGASCGFLFPRSRFNLFFTFSTISCDAGEYIIILLLSYPHLFLAPGRLHGTGGFHLPEMPPNCPRFLTSSSCIVLFRVVRDLQRRTEHTPTIGKDGPIAYDPHRMRKSRPTLQESAPAA